MDNPEPQQPKTPLPAFPAGRPPSTGASGDMPLWVCALLCLLFCAGMLWSTAGATVSLFGAATVIFSDGLLAGLVFVSACGYGWLLLRLFGLNDAPPALLLATSAALGLWLYATAMMIVGSLVAGSLDPNVWWTVVVIGGALGIVQVRGQLRSISLPGRVGGSALVWILVATAGGILLAALTLPPGYLGHITADSYDILEYHAQLPREFFEAGRVSTLDHNIYSHYPLSSEMLFLLGMCLRGSAYQGIYLCQMMNGLLAVVAVLAIFGLKGMPIAPGARPTSFPPEVEDDLTARFGVALLATSPWVLYLSGLAMEEIGQIAFAALALVWLKYWLARPGMRAGVLLGVLLGASCCFKYLSVGLVAAPVLAVMLVGSLRRSGWHGRPIARRNWRRLAQWLAVAGTALVVFSPWLVRNCAATGNPVFPLAMSIFGHNGLTREQALRWEHAHSPELQPPVPTPLDWQRPPQPTRTQQILGFFVGRTAQPPLGAIITLLLIATILAMVARPRGIEPWTWSLLAVLVIQVAVWALFTRDMPGRFLAVAIPTICLLIASGLVRLAGVKEIHVLRQNVPPGTRWGMGPALLLLTASAILNLMAARAFLLVDFRDGFPEGDMPLGVPAVLLGQQLWNGNGRLLLVGESRAFYFPSGTLYATVYNTNPLQEVLKGTRDAQGLASGLRQLGVKNVWLGAGEIGRISYTIGWPREMAMSALEEMFKGYTPVHMVPLAATRPSATQPGSVEQAIAAIVLAVPEGGQ